MSEAEQVVPHRVRWGPGNGWGYSYRCRCGWSGWSGTLDQADRAIRGHLDALAEGP